MPGAHPGSCPCPCPCPCSCESKSAPHAQLGSKFARSALVGAVNHAVGDQSGSVIVCCRTCDVPACLSPFPSLNLAHFLVCVHSGGFLSLAPPGWKFSGKKEKEKPAGKRIRKRKAMMRSVAPRSSTCCTTSIARELRSSSTIYATMSYDARCQL